MTYTCLEKILLKLIVWVVTGLLLIGLGYLCIMCGVVANVFVSFSWGSLLLVAACAFLAIGALFLNIVTEQIKKLQQIEKFKSDLLRKLT